MPRPSRRFGSCASGLAFRVGIDVRGRIGRGDLRRTPTIILLPIWLRDGRGPRICRTRLIAAFPSRQFGKMRHEVYRRRGGSRPRHVWRIEVRPNVRPRTRLEHRNRHTGHQFRQGNRSRPSGVIIGQFPPVGDQVAPEIVGARHPTAMTPRPPHRNEERLFRHVLRSHTLFYRRSWAGSAEASYASCVAGGP